MFNFRKTSKTPEGNIVDSGLTESPRPDNGKALKGERGRIEQWVQAEKDGRFSFNYVDVGNYGKERWTSKAYCTRDELLAIVDQLTALAGGDVTTTRLPTEEPAAEATAPTLPAPAVALPVENESTDTLTA